VHHAVSLDTISSATFFAPGAIVASEAARVA